MEEHPLHDVATAAAAPPVVPQPPPPSSTLPAAAQSLPHPSPSSPRDECHPSSIAPHAVDDAHEPQVPDGASSAPDDVTGDLHAAVEEQHARPERVHAVAVSSQLTDASQPSLHDMASDLQHDLHAVAQHAVHVKAQPQTQPSPSTAVQQDSQPMQAAETQLSEQSAQHAMEFSAAAEQAQQAIVDAEHQSQPTHDSQELMATTSESQLVQPTAPSVPDSDMQQSTAVAHALQKTEAQLDAHNALSEQHASHLAPSGAFPPATVSVSVPAAVGEYAVNKPVDDEHARVASEFDPKLQQSPHPSVAITPRRIVERAKRGSERYHASGEQLKTLIAAFEQNPTPDASTLNYLSDAIGMPMHNLVLWFKNRRARHKRTHINQLSRGGKRSYVKSGIYSRNKRVKQGHHHPAPTTVPSGGLTLPLSHGLTSISSPLPVSSIALPVDAKNAAMTVGSRDIEELIKSGAPHSSRMKRPRFSAIPELVGDDNPCQAWTSDECHRRCVAFFERATNSAFPEQSKIVEHVSSEFFLSELQSGLTLVSAMQPLETSVGVLDAIMEKLPAEGPRLSSGSKVIMREFLAQIRMGSAEQFAIIEGPADAGEAVAESHAAEAQTVAPAAASSGEP
ncbi:hypothetical protein FGB62_76g0103 [Gracilaria domingensis]|nr:hypothetical protein FGB62_76g0103 [Gracilaria domingensis]